MAIHAFHHEHGLTSPLPRFLYVDVSYSTLAEADVGDADRPRWIPVGKSQHSRNWLGLFLGAVDMRRG